jgi:Zn-dependent peptidase ImmA (M78 family)
MAFDPKHLRYDEHGIPILRAPEIEAIADELLERYCPDVLMHPRETPVVEIIGKLRQRTGLLFKMEDLGYRGSAKVMGKVSFHKKTLFLDLTLNDERKAAFRFTAAHEIGHWILHRYNYKNWKLDKNLNLGDLDDDEKTLCRMESRSPKDWLEKQANVFAASLVMPRKMFRSAVITQQKAMGITRNIGQVYLSSEGYSHRDYRALVARLSHVFGVSQESVRVRIDTLKLLVNAESAKKLAQDQGEENTTHFGEAFWQAFKGHSKKEER